MSAAELLALILQLPAAERLELLRQLHDAIYHPTYSIDAPERQSKAQERQ